MGLGGERHGHLDVVDIYDLRERGLSVHACRVAVVDFDPVSYLHAGTRVAPHLVERYDLTRDVSDGKDDRAVLARPLKCGGRTRGAASVNLYAVELILSAAEARV